MSITAWPPMKLESMVPSTRLILKAGFGNSVRNMVQSPGPSPVRAMMMPNAAPSAPVISHLRPLMM